MSEEEKVEMSENEISDNLDIVVFKMIKRCIDLATEVRGVKNKAKILGILSDLEVTHQALGSIAFALCDIDEDDFEDYFVEDNKDIINKLTKNEDS